MNKKAKGRNAWPAFRSKNKRGDQMATYTAPFTDMPEERKIKRFSFKSFFQGLLNFVFMTVLGLTLVALVAAFAFVLITEPEKLVTFFSSIVSAIEAFIASFQ